MTMRLGEESGFALIGAMMLALVMLSLGFAVVAGTDTQQNLSRGERTRESSFNVAEAALQAQAVQFARSWPSSAVPTCNPTATSSLCPEPAAVGGGYTSTDYASSCPSSPSRPVWETRVRDNALGEQYWSTAVNARAAYDANADNFIWVGATGFVQCREVIVVALISRSVLALDFPNKVLSVNWYRTTTQGKKVLLDTLGQYAQPPPNPPITAAQAAAVAVRCTGLVYPGDCTSYPTDRDKGQVKPYTVIRDTTGGSSALSLSQLEAIERQARGAGTYWPKEGKSCPTTAAELTGVAGAPVVVEGPCTVSLNGGPVNTSASPGALVIKNGTLSLGGTAIFYGLLYMVNKQGSSASLVNVSGNASLQGVISIDGLGGLTLGSSKTNLVYDPRAVSLLRGDSGATVNKNTFRVLPRGTPQ